ncbi:hypothetical protein DPMN_075545 [Dreissena polymorpha]|uniref:Uncharacterized protein n=1 Tax=Dreissena polymorpha TaxID=45954 RepID=A0A9D3YIB3_DREPO|nr:hypothetical protein DPMN_075545 [Dreissena polymorpha]
MALETNVLTKVNEDWTNNVISRVFTCFHYIHIDKTDTPPNINKTNVLTKKTAPKQNVLTKFHEDWTQNVTTKVFTCFQYKHKEKTAPPPGGHVFSPIWTIFELVRDINKTNVLIKCHDDWAKILTYRVFTRKTVPPTGGHVFQWTGTTFELNQHII